jgi:hypothetical protein
MSDQGSGKDKRRDRQARLVRMHDSLELFKRRALYRASPVLLVQYLSLKYRGRLFRPRRARSFEDKLLWLMLYWREPLKTLCAESCRPVLRGDYGPAHLPGLLNSCGRRRH